MLLQDQPLSSQANRAKKVTDHGRGKQPQTLDNNQALVSNPKLQTKADGSATSSPRGGMLIFGSNISPSRTRGQSSVNLADAEKLGSDPTTRPLNQSVYAESFQISKRDS